MDTQEIIDYQNLLFQRLTDMPKMLGSRFFYDFGMEKNLIKQNTILRPLRKKGYIKLRGVNNQFIELIKLPEGWKPTPVSPTFFIKNHQFSYRSNMQEPYTSLKVRNSPADSFHLNTPKLDLADKKKLPVLKNTHGAHFIAWGSSTLDDKPNIPEKEPTPTKPVPAKPNPYTLQKTLWKLQDDLEESIYYLYDWATEGYQKRQKEKEFVPSQIKGKKIKRKRFKRRSLF